MKYINKRLTLEKVNFQKIAKKFGTPFYCYSYSKLKENVNKFKENLFETDEMYKALINFYQYGFVIFKNVPTNNNFIINLPLYN